MKFIPLIFLLSLLGATTQDNSQWNKIVLGKDSTEFLEMYNNLKTVNEIRTEGYYYCLESVLSYNLISIQGLKMRREKESTDKNMDYVRQILDTNMSYYFDCLWLNKDGSCFIPSWGMNPDLDSPSEYHRKLNETKNISEMTNNFLLLYDSIGIQSLKGMFNRKHYVNSEKGIYKISNNQVKIYYFECPYGGGDKLKYIDGKVINDSTLILEFENRKYVNNVHITTDTTYKTYKFHKSNFIPSLESMKLNPSKFSPVYHPVIDFECE
ncbi:MAG: hypothetical protein HZB41_05315 [Ignavibacteriae bacterium]|nr:hypothetical protein [Ignavibacteriota bacterium]